MDAVKVAPAAECDTVVVLTRDLGDSGPSVARRQAHPLPVPPDDL
ncbi:hypothetical protein ACIBCS_15700 [Streptomyces phaeochromogenes]